MILISLIFLYRKQNEIKKFTSKIEENKMKNLLEKEGDFKTKYNEIKEEYKEVEKRVLAMTYTEDILNQCYDKYYFIN